MKEKIKKKKLKPELKTNKVACWLPLAFLQKHMHSYLSYTTHDCYYRDAAIYCGVNSSVLINNQGNPPQTCLLSSICLGDFLTEGNISDESWLYQFKNLINHINGLCSMHSFYQFCCHRKHRVIYTHLLL